MRELLHQRRDKIQERHHQDCQDHQLEKRPSRH